MCLARLPPCPEQPEKFQRLINLNVARELGLKVLQSILLRADSVIA